MNDPISLIRSAVPGIAWPAIPGADGAHALALQFQFELSQWYTREQLQDLQFRQLDALLRHAHGTVPYYAEKWAGIYDPAVPLTPERFARLPVLRRRALQENFEALKSRAPLCEHGVPVETRSSGSTGTPVRVLKTPLNEMVWQGVMLREQLWHRRDLGGKIAVIRRTLRQAEVQGWGDYLGNVAITGPAALLPVSAEISRQLDWLREQQPNYLLTYPSNVAELARLALERGIRLPHLRQILTMGEVVSPELRDVCEQAWGVPIADTYSAEEAGYLALQCPDHLCYHVQAETVLVEILDTRGKPCAPGEAGLVVVTPLHSFAMPLVRYVVGDYAKVGHPCPCGRGLPVLAAIVGRSRNTLVLETGERYWPFFGTHAFTDIAPVVQHQFVQKDFRLIEARLVTARPLTREEEKALVQHVQAKLPASFEVRLAYVPEIPRSPGGKYEDFVSEIADAVAS